MAKTPSKFFVIWSGIAVATLYLPFQEFLRSQEYESADAFFEDILFWVLILGFLLVPPIVVWAMRRSRVEKSKGGKSVSS